MAKMKNVLSVRSTGKDVKELEFSYTGSIKWYIPSGKKHASFLKSKNGIYSR